MRTKAGVIIPGVRHCHAIKFGDQNGFDMAQSEPGFLDNCNQFLTRAEAWVLAEKAGQILPDSLVTPGQLFSENLY
jgi:hypothetical protein